VADAVVVTVDVKRLHDHAHASVSAQRDVDGWWGTPMETALIAAAGIRHTAGSREMSNAALDQLVAWSVDPGPRVLGDNAAALALTAKAARDLRGGSGALLHQAVELVDAVCSGSEILLAPLHVALVAWALDDLVPDRQQAPWSAMRTALGRFSNQGLNDALVSFASTLADGRRTHTDLRLTQVAVSGRAEECILLWLLTAAAAYESSRPAAEPDPSDLEQIGRRRTELLDQLMAELEGQPLVPVEVADFDPFSEGAEERQGLHIFEAVMLDLALSDEYSSTALITLEESSRLIQRAANGRRMIYASVTAAATLVCAGMATTISVLASATTKLPVTSANRLSAGIAISLLGTGAAIVVLLLRGLDRALDRVSIVTGLCLEVFLGLFLILEGSLARQFVDDQAATIIGLLFVGLPLLVQPLVGLVVNRQRKR